MSASVNAQIQLEAFLINGIRGGVKVVACFEDLILSAGDDKELRYGSTSTYFFSNKLFLSKVSFVQNVGYEDTYGSTVY